MWQSKTVERALFQWHKWRWSIISRWSKPDYDLKLLSHTELYKEVNNELQIFEFPSSVFLGLYWICCVTSDYNLDYVSSFDNIIVPKWLPIPDNLKPSIFVHAFKEIPYAIAIKPGDRLYPPCIISENDIDFAKSQVYEGWLFGDAYYPEKNQDAIILPEKHELKLTLSQVKGRPKVKGKVGAPPYYSDRLAVKCAVLKHSGMKDLRIGHEIEPDLLEEEEWNMLPKDIAHHLIAKGNMLLNKHGLISL